MKIKIKKIKDPNTSVPINSEHHRIAQIKDEIISCDSNLKTCEVPVFDMWEDMDKNCSKDA